MKNGLKLTMQGRKKKKGFPFKKKRLKNYLLQDPSKKY